MSVNVTRYDLLHNSHLGLQGLDELFKVAQVQTVFSLFQFSLTIIICYLPRQVTNEHDLSW